MKAKLLFTILLISFRSFSQGEASNWFFGDRAGIKFNANNSITVLSTLPNSIGINTAEGCSSYSDSSGNLLLYTDGRTVWDRNHIIMPNGDYFGGTGLLGDPSSTQSGIIVPKPNNPNIYYVFTVDEPHQANAATYPNQNMDGFYPQEDDGLNNGLNYSVIDMSIIGVNGSIGDVTVRNEHLVTYNVLNNLNEIKYKCSEKITAVKSSDGNSYWVIPHFVNRFYAFKVDVNGVNSTPVISINNPIVPIAGYRRNAIGYLKASPDGKKIAIAHNQLGTESGDTVNNGTTYLYDFDNETGIVSNGIEVIKDIPQYGVEFSSQSQKLYVSGNEGVFQFNLLAPNIPQSKVLISSSSASALQLGPDGKIYKANISNNRNFLDAINFPELDCVACGYQERAVNLEGGISTFGLPPFITSVFNSNIIAEGTCVGNAVNFSLDLSDDVDSITWEFGDGNTSTINEPSYTYVNPGRYVVTSTAIIGGNRSFTRKTIEISLLKVRTITVHAYNNPTIKNIAISDISDNNTVTVYLPDASIGNSGYSLDAPSGPFQRSNHFENVQPGEHTVYVYDNKGCGIATEKITVLRIPKFFSPNDDGYNETWNILGLDTKFYNEAKITIFDRYRKLIYSSNKRQNGWDGNFNGMALVATDYWYRIILNTGREIKGHFSLVR